MILRLRALIIGSLWFFSYAGATGYKVVDYRHHVYPDRCVRVVYDYHPGIVAAHKQREDLLAWAESQWKPGADGIPLFIVEDRYYSRSTPEYTREDYEKALKAIKDGQESVSSGYGFLYGFGHRCAAKGFDVVNIDRRNMITFLIESSYSRVTPSGLYGEIQHIMATIRGYNDGSYLNEYYQDVLKRFTTTHAGFLKSLFDLRGQKRYNPQSLKEQHAINHDFGSEFIDAAIMHELVTNQARKTIIICAGGSHALGIEEHLKNVGYIQTAMHVRSATIDSDLVRIREEAGPAVDRGWATGKYFEHESRENCIQHYVIEHTAIDLSRAKEYSRLVGASSSSSSSSSSSLSSSRQPDVAGYIEDIASKVGAKKGVLTEPGEVGLKSGSSLRSLVAPSSSSSSSSTSASNTSPRPHGQKRSHDSSSGDGDSDESDGSVVKPTADKKGKVAHLTFSKFHFDILTDNGVQDIKGDGANH